MRGKKVCKILKEIRQEIAVQNEIDYAPADCHYQGECPGTCPNCEAELKYLENELHRRTQLGKAVSIAGISLGIASTFAACNAPQQSDNPPISEQEIATETVNADTVSMDTTLVIPPPVKMIKVIGKEKVAVKDSLTVLPEFIVEAEHLIWEKNGLMTVETGILFPQEISPVYPGGETARIKFIQEHLVYPRKAKKQRIEGEVLIGFVVETDGSLTDFAIVKSVHPLLDKEALRVAKLMPKWKTNQQFRSQHQISIPFSLENK